MKKSNDIDGYHLRLEISKSSAKAVRLNVAEFINNRFNLRYKLYSRTDWFLDKSPYLDTNVNYNAYYSVERRLFLKSEIR